MKIKKEFIRIGHLPGTVGGGKLEPEQQPLQHVQTIDAGVTGATTKGALGTIPTEIIAEHSVGEYAQSERAKCWGCKHFSSKDWLKLKKAMEYGPIEKRKELGRIRAALLTTDNAQLHDAHEGDEGTDVEHALSSLGICGPMTEIDGKEAVIVNPLGSCPDNLCSMQHPNGLFMPKDRESDRHGSAAYDKIMQLASGKA